MQVGKLLMGAVSVLILAEHTDTAGFNPVLFHNRNNTEGEWLCYQT